MKKLIMCGLVLSVILMAFSTCDYWPDDVQYLRIKYNDGAINQSPIMVTTVTSKTELEQYISQYSVFNSFGFEKYTDDYFINNFLVIVFLGEGSSSVKHTVDKIDKNNKEIIIKRVSPFEQTDDLRPWILFVEIKVIN